MDKILYSQPSSGSVSARLRTIRTSRGLSLVDVEKATRGKFKAATLGSYERSDRSLSVARAIELATYYKVPLMYLLDGTGGHECGAGKSEIIFDLRRIRDRTSLDTRENSVINLLSQIAQKRSDWNGEVLSLRYSDLSTLALLLHIQESEVVGWLRERNFLLKTAKEPNQP